MARSWAKPENPKWGGMKCGKRSLEFHWLTIDKITEVYFSPLRVSFIHNLNVKSKKSSLPKFYTVLIVCERLSFESVSSNLFSEGPDAEQVSVTFSVLWGATEEHNSEFFHSYFLFHRGRWHLLFGLIFLTSAPAWSLPSLLSLLGTFPSQRHFFFQKASFTSTSCLVCVRS